MRGRLVYDGVWLTDKQLRKAGDCSRYRVPVTSLPGAVDDAPGGGSESALITAAAAASTTDTAARERAPGGGDGSATGMGLGVVASLEGSPLSPVEELEGDGAGEDPDAAAALSLAAVVGELDGEGGAFALDGGPGATYVPAHCNLKAYLCAHWHIVRH
jgi:hypothetical protein